MKALVLAAVVAAGSFAPVVASEPRPAGFVAVCDGETPTVMDFDGEIQGTPGDDVIAGNNGDNTIYANGGEDTICTGGGTTPSTSPSSRRPSGTPYTCGFSGARGTTPSSYPT
jgi:hypothetical protein